MVANDSESYWEIVNPNVDNLIPEPDHANKSPGFLTLDLEGFTLHPREKDKINWEQKFIHGLIDRGTALCNIQMPTPISLVEQIA